MKEIREKTYNKINGLLAPIEEQASNKRRVTDTDKTQMKRIFAERQEKANPKQVSVKR